MYAFYSRAAVAGITTLFAMNYLAHLLLASHSEEAMLGALLGDFVKAGAINAFEPAIAREIIIHRRIDSFTDGHAVNRRARLHFSAKERRFAGILLDVFYDHVLSLKWDSYCSTPLVDFVQQFYVLLRRHEPILPDNLLSILPYFVERNWLCRYHNLSGVALAIQGISQHLSKNGEHLAGGVSVLARDYTHFCQCFEAFFPELVEFVNLERQKIENLP